MATTVPRSKKGTGSNCEICGKCKVFTRIQDKKRKIERLQIRDYRQRRRLNLPVSPQAIFVSATPSHAWRLCLYGFAHDSESVLLSSRGVLYSIKDVLQVGSTEEVRRAFRRTAGRSFSGSERSCTASPTQISESEGRLLGAGVAHSPGLGPGADQRTDMKTTKLLVIVLTLFAIGSMVGCSRFSAKSPDVADSLRKALDQAGLKNVSVSEDRDRGIVTLGGEVASDDQKTQADSLAKSLAGGQVVADQIAVLPVGDEREAKAMNSDLDQGIAKNLDAALIQNKMHQDVNYSVKSGVVTLSGEVNSQDNRALAEKVATAVPNVQQVVNNLQVKNQKATSGQ